MRDDELLRRYLLGGLSGDEKDRLESRLIQERSLFELAEAMEDEVLDDYSRGRLDSAERIRVERRLLAKPEGRSQLALIRGLGKIADEERTARILPWPVRDLSRPQRRFAAIAAMLLIGVGSAWLIQQTAMLPEKAIHQRAEHPEMPEPTPPVPTPTPIEIEQKTELAQVEATPAPAPSPRIPLVELSFAALMRGGPDEPLPSVEVPAGSQKFDLRIALSERDTLYPSYEVVLTDTSTGGEVTQTSRIDGKALVLRLDGSELNEGSYHLFIQGIDAEGKAEPLIERDIEIRMPMK